MRTGCPERPGLFRPDPPARDCSGCRSGFDLHPWFVFFKQACGHGYEPTQPGSPVGPCDVWPVGFTVEPIRELTVSEGFLSDDEFGTIPVFQIEEPVAVTEHDLSGVAFQFGCARHGHAKGMRPLCA